VQKKIIEEPIYETVQTGVNKKEIWVTSDGKEHDNEQYAEQHEFYRCKVKQRGFGIHHHLTILDLHCVEDLERYEKDYTYNVNHYDYNKKKLVFPNTYVLIEEDEKDCSEDFDDYDYAYPEVHLKIYTVDQFRKLVNKALDDINELK
jgi:hypothetical protein